MGKFKYEIYLEATDSNGAFKRNACYKRFNEASEAYDWTWNGSGWQINKIELVRIKDQYILYSFEEIKGIQKEIPKKIIANEANVKHALSVLKDLGYKYIINEKTIMTLPMYELMYKNEKVFNVHQFLGDTFDYIKSGEVKNIDDLLKGEKHD